MIELGNWKASEEMVNCGEHKEKTVYVAQICVWEMIAAFREGSWQGDSRLAEGGWVREWGGRLAPILVWNALE